MDWFFDHVWGITLTVICSLFCSLVLLVIYGALVAANDADRAADSFSSEEDVWEK